MLAYPRIRYSWDLYAVAFIYMSLNIFVSDCLNSTTDHFYLHSVVTPIHMYYTLLNISIHTYVCVLVCICGNMKKDLLFHLNRLHATKSQTCWHCISCSFCWGFFSVNNKQYNNSSLKCLSLGHDCFALQQMQTAQIQSLHTKKNILVFRLQKLPKKKHTTQGYKHLTDWPSGSVLCHLVSWRNIFRNVGQRWERMCCWSVGWLGWSVLSTLHTHKSWHFVVDGQDNDDSST